MSFRTVSSSTSPLTESPSKSIQPSLKPSSIWTRGAGFFMPCDLNRSSQDSRGTASMRTGRPRILENAAAISFGLTRRGPSNSSNGYPQAAKCLLHQTELGEQIGAGCLRADCRDAHDLGRVCCLKGGPHGIGRSPRLWETRLWIEDRRREYEDAFGSLERGCESCRVIHLRQCQLTATF